jgi:hypothetical protein
MDQGLAGIIVAVITAIGGIIVAVIHSARKENRRDHASVVAALIRIRSAVEKTKATVEKVEDKLDRHLLDHEKEMMNGTDRRH